MSLGADDVGYIVRFDNKSSKNTTLKYVTAWDTRSSADDRQVSMIRYEPVA